MYSFQRCSRFAIVEQSGNLTRHTDDTKIASKTLKIVAQLSIAGLVKAAIEYTFSRSTPEGASATGYCGAASATGDQGAASATGKYGQVSGIAGTALFLVERDDDWNIIHAWAGIVGKDGIEPSTWYTLRDGKPTKVGP